uniref:DUF4793 domain-containing protein n=1 Tax=Haemonchus contortus TaxID=6289 RepID=A0A7I4YQZ8_HAECO
MITTLIKWTLLQLLPYTVLMEQDYNWYRELKRVYIPANNLSVNPLMLLDGRFAHVFDFNDLSDIRVSITFQRGSCLDRNYAQLVIITFLDHWYPPDMLDGAQLLDNSIVLDGAGRLEDVRDEYGYYRGRQYYYSYIVYTKDSDRIYESIRYSPTTVDYFALERGKLYFTHHLGALWLHLSRPFSSLTVDHGFSQRLHRERVGVNATALYVNTNKTRYFLISASRTERCPVHISWMSDHAAPWTRFSLIPQLGLPKKERERITVLRDIIIACIVIVGYYYVLNYIYPSSALLQHLHATPKTYCTATTTSIGERDAQRIRVESKTFGIYPRNTGPSKLGTQCGAFQGVNP